MTANKDKEVDLLRRQAGISALECANYLNISYSSFCQRIGGFCKWKVDEREQLIDYINRRIKDERRSIDM